MITVGHFVEMFLIVYALALAFECISRLTYFHDPPRLIMKRFKSILIRCLVLTTIFMISTVVWTEMGWVPRHMVQPSQAQGKKTPSAVLHFPQNFMLAGFSNSHFGQRIATSIDEDASAMPEVPAVSQSRTTLPSERLIAAD
jgi:hypothetical protein